jgi:hypothetical protein
MFVKNHILAVFLLEFNVKLWLSEMSRVECLNLSDVLLNVAAVIFGVNM